MAKRFLMSHHIQFLLIQKKTISILDPIKT
jgi:hypothetical protein